MKFEFDSPIKGFVFYIDTVMEITIESIDLIAPTFVGARVIFGGGYKSTIYHDWTFSRQQALQARYNLQERKVSEIEAKIDELHEQLREELKVLRRLEV